MASVQSLVRGNNTSHPPLLPPTLRQVLLTAPRSSPITLWMPEPVAVGDFFSWRDRIWTVSQVYGTHVTSSISSEVSRTERPHKHRQAGVRIDTAD